MAEYTIETYKAGYWTWVIRDTDGSQMAYGGYCLTRREARKDALDWLSSNLKDVPSKAELQYRRTKARTMRKETYSV